MKCRCRLVATCVTTAIGFAACAPQLHAPPSADAPEQVGVRLDHGYGLLYDLLGDESKVADILAIKSASQTTRTLLVDISAAAARAHATIEGMRTGNPPLDLEVTGLPLVEIDARHRIANSQTAALLTAFDSFELKILLTQRSACEYAWALASSLAALDPNKARSEAMSKVAAEFDALLMRVVAQLSVTPQPPPVK